MTHPNPGAGPPEFPHGGLSRAELAQAARQCQAAAVHSRGALAAAWRQLAGSLAQLAAQRDPAHHLPTRRRLTRTARHPQPAPQRPAPPDPAPRTPEPAQDISAAPPHTGACLSCSRHVVARVHPEEAHGGR